MKRRSFLKAAGTIAGTCALGVRPMRAADENTAKREGDSKAAQFLLAARHGLSDKAPEQGGERVNITFQLPAAMDPSEYLRAVQVQPQKPELEAL